MLDPLTALSVAGTIVQFVDFSYKVITGSVQLYKSGNGVLKTNEVLDLVTSDLLKLTTKLHRLDDIQGSQSDDEKALIDLCTSSNDIADEILSKLKTLKSQSLGKDIKGRVLLRHKTWATFRGAIKSAWKEEELSKLNQRLSGLKQSLELRVLVGIWYLVIFKCIIKTNQHFQRKSRSHVYTNVGSVQCLGSAYSERYNCSIRPP
jgi:hypothetical protein